MEEIKRKILNKVKKVLPGNLPDVIIGGTQKSGTTSLYNYLSVHPQMIASSGKEVAFFDWKIHHGKDINWYKSCFKTIGSRKNKLFFEATPNYIYHPEVPGLVKQFAPDVKLIFTFREPVARAFSAWNMYKDFFNSGRSSRFLLRRLPNEPNPIYTHLFENRNVFPTFREAIDIELDLMKNRGPSEPAILRKGLYAQQLKNWFPHFDKSNIHIIGFKDLVQQPEQTLNKITEFLHIDKFSHFKSEKQVFNKGAYAEKISDTDKEFLSDFYSTHNRLFFTMIGKELNW